MGLFRRSAAPVWDLPAPRWNSTGTPETVPAYLVDDDGCAGENAYQVMFWLDGVPGTRITVWFYASYAAPEKGSPYCYQIAARHDYQCGAGAEAWLRTEYDLASEEIYYELLADADDSARHYAGVLAGVIPWPDYPRLWPRPTWDGVPW